MLLMAMTASACGAREEPAAGPTITITQVTRNGRPRAALRGDWRIESEALSVVVAGMRRTPAERGRVLTLRLRDTQADDDFDFLTTLVRVGGQDVLPTIASVDAHEVRGRPVVRILGTVELNRGIAYERLVTMADTEGVVSISTCVQTTREMSLVERLAWGGAPPFVPGVGRLRDDEPHDVPWVGHQGARRAFVLGSREGEGTLTAVYRSHGPHAFLRHTDLVLGGVAQDDRRCWRSLIAVAPGSLAEAVRKLGWARGSPYPEAVVALGGEQAELAIRVLLGDRSPWLATRGAEGAESVIIPLPPGVSGTSVIATAYGHAATQRVPLAVGDRVRLMVPASATLRVRITDASTGAAMPGRARLRGLSPTPTPVLGPDWDAGGAGDTRVSADGEAIIHAATGRYELIVSRGPEWSLSKQLVTFTGAVERTVRVALRRQVDPGRWVPGDFHLHAAPSADSQVTLEDRVTALVAEGVRFAVPTDHNQVTDYSAAAEALGLDTFITTPGVEVSTWEPQFGHFNAFPYPYDPDHPYGGAPNYQGLTPAQLFANLHDARSDVLVQVNHPRLEPMGIGFFDVTELDPSAPEAATGYDAGYDTLEVWNGFDLARLERVERNLTEWMRLLAAGGRHVATGSSDSHTIRSEWAGYPRTYVRVQDGVAQDAENILIGLIKGRAFVTNGPLLLVDVAGAGPGETAQIGRGRFRVHVVVRAPDWMSIDQVDIYVGPTLASSTPLPATDSRARRALPAGTRVDRAFSLRATTSGFVVVVVRGSTPMTDLFGRQGVLPMAFTNPIWLSAPVR